MLRTLQNLLLALALLGAHSVSARDIHVDNVAGDDTRLGERSREYGEQQGPVRTIGRALRLANGEDTIILTNTGMPYRESFSLVGGNHSGSPEQPFVIEGNGSVVDGAVKLPYEFWENHEGPVFRYRPKRLAFQQLFLAGRPLKFVAPLDKSGRPPELKPLEWSLAGGFVYFKIQPAKLIEDYDLEVPFARVGVTLYDVHDVVIRNLTVQGFSLDGISVFDGVRDTVLYDVVSRGNGRSGIAVANASDVRIVEALVGDNLFAQVLTEGLSFTRVENCDLLTNTAPAIIRQGGSVLVDGVPFTGN